MTGAEIIAAERKRQVEVEGWTPEHDDEHCNGTLAWAAVAFAAPGPVYRIITNIGSRITFSDPFPESWDRRWDRRGFHRVAGTPELESRIDLLGKAGALIAAEIDRLQRVKDAVK